MTHDRLCPYKPERRTGCDHFGAPNSLGFGVSCAVLHFLPEVPCQCDLISTIRADERNYMKKAFYESDGDADYMFWKAERGRKYYES